MIKSVKSAPFHPYLPFIMACFLLLISASFYQKSVYITLIYPFIFYFRLFNPSFLPIIAVFLLGLLSDILMPAPIGFNVVLYGVFYFLTYKNRLYLQKMPFYKMWGCYGILLGIIMLLGALLIYTMYQSAVDLWGVGGDFVGFMLIFPFLYYFSAYIDKIKGCAA